MSERISVHGRSLWWHRYGSAIFGAVFIFAIAALSPFPAEFRLLVLPVFLPILAAVSLYGHQFKEVFVADSCLVVVHRNAPVHVPFGSIAKISLSWACNPSTVLVVLRDRSLLGRRILFVPKSRDAARRLLAIVHADPSGVCVHRSSESRS